ncbi:MAG: substrate-binding domain-containing protein [Betaproteobacteria bacterium]|nr:substrate-binding domain-containing protein [Betaproteobacteria bacterium]
MTTLRILGAGPVKRGVTRLAAEFEKRSGHRVSVEFAGAPGVRDRVLAGEAVDVAVVPQAAMDELVQQGKVVAGTRARMGRSRLGIVARKGTWRPDISSTDTFKQAMLDAAQIVCNGASSGVYMVQLLEKLGIGEATKDKVLKLPDAVKVMEHVAASPERAIGVGQLAEISELVDKGVVIALVAPLPDAIQNATAYDAAVAAASGQQEAARALASFLGAPEAKAVFAATGID